MLIPDVLELVNANILLIFQHSMERVLGERSTASGSDPVRIQTFTDLMQGPAGDILLEDPADDRRRFRVDRIPPVGPFDIPERRLPKYLTLQCRVIASAFDILRQVRGVILRQRFHQAFEDDPFRTVGDCLHYGVNFHTGLLQLVTIDSSVVPVPGEAIELPDNQSREGAGFSLPDHSLESRTCIGPARDRRVRIFLHDPEAVRFSIPVTLAELTFDGFLPLVAGGVTSINDSRNELSHCPSPPDPADAGSPTECVDQPRETPPGFQDPPERQRQGRTIPAACCG